MKQPNSLRVLTLVMALFLCGSLLRAQTTHYVTSLADDGGTGTLRYIVNNATSGDIIEFNVTGTITLISGEINLNKDLTISGPGEANLTISGNNNSRIFNIPDATPDHTISISGLTLSEGFTTSSGGAIYNYSDNLTLENCTFTSNVANNGGGMFNSSSPTLLSCTFSGNTSGSHAGGMYNHSSSDPTVTNCLFIENIAANSGGGMYNSSSDPTVVNCTFTGNEATSGGGMYNDNSSPVGTNCTFTGNKVTGDYCSGGGMMNSSSNPTLTNCTFTGNTSTYLGGGDV